MNNKLPLPPFKQIIWVLAISIVMYIYLSNNPPNTQIGYWITISTPIIGIIVSLLFGIGYLFKKGTR
ncbi:hypothetical protein BN2127_JRS10_02706 [Bacillus subtilis]|nr:hypothetical protein BN2127_JRS10_02706 [Bacillus subtilis]